MAIWTEFDKVIKMQLKRKSLLPYKISSFCKYNYPQVIELLPDEKKPHFKTLYWLTCPYLSKKIGKLESEGFITKLSEYIKENVEIFKSQTQKYSKILEKTAENKLGYVPENIKELGVGGISDIMFPKCLHAHFAYYLIDKSYIAGEFINKNIESLNCDNNYCKEQEEVKK